MSVHTRFINIRDYFVKLNLYEENWQYEMTVCFPKKWITNEEYAGINIKQIDTTEDDLYDVHVISLTNENYSVETIFDYVDYVIKFNREFEAIMQEHEEKLKKDQEELILKLQNKLSSVTTKKNITPSLDNSIDPEITENKGFDDDDEEPKIIINK